MSAGTARQRAYPARRRADGLLIWTVGILTLIGFALASWIGSYYVFGHPELPLSYSLLKRIGKIDQPKLFRPIDAPQGEFVGAAALAERMATLSGERFDAQNRHFLRSFLTNYVRVKTHRAESPIYYVVGEFVVVETHPLGRDTVFPTGVVSLARSVEWPDLFIEHLFPTSKENVNAARALLRPGTPISFGRERDLSVVIQARRFRDGRQLLTVVPLHYGRYGAAGDDGLAFSCEPPSVIHLERGWPVFRDVRERIERAKPMTPPPPVVSHKTPSRPVFNSPPIAPAVSPPPADIPPPAGDPPAPVPPPPSVAAAPAPPVPDGTPLPGAGGAVSDVEPVAPRAVPVAPRALPVSGQAATRPIPRAVPAEPAAVAPAVPSAEPVLPMPVAVATPVTSRAGRTQPFFVPAPREISGVGGGAPGVSPAQAPGGGSRSGGRRYRVDDLGGLEAADLAAAPAYLVGDFEVKAVDNVGNSALLRSPSNTEAARIIVQYPPGRTPPPLNSAVQRDPSRPFRISRVERSGSGTLNVWVHEPIAP